jgi:hypothetical protein
MSHAGAALSPRQADDLVDFARQCMALQIDPVEDYELIVRT